MAVLLNNISFTFFRFGSYSIWSSLQPDKVKFFLRLGQSKPLYNAFKAIQESPDWNSLSEACQRIVECEYHKPFIYIVTHFFLNVME